MIKTHYYAKYKKDDGTSHWVKIFTYSKNMVDKHLWVAPQFGESSTGLIAVETQEDFKNRGWYKVIEVVKEQTIIKRTKVY